MKKKFYLLLVVITVLMLQSASVFAYENTETGTIGGNTVSIRVRNTIDSTQRNAYAETWTSNPSTSVSVSATFYWEDYSTLEFGSCYKSGGGYGSHSVSGDPVSGGRYYYKVVSNHGVSYNGERYTFNNLITFVP